MPHTPTTPWSRLKRATALALLTTCTLAMAQQPTAPATAAAATTDTAALDGLIRDAMLYAYPYQEFMKLRNAALHDKDGPTYTTLNHFRHARKLAGPQDRWANAPINDTFYSTNWLDVGNSPVILTVPETAGRYYVVAMVGADLNTFGYVGSRLSGTAPRRIAVVAPDWNGKLPEVDQIIRSPTRDIYLNLRVLVKGPDDLARAHAIQDAFTTVPLDASARQSEPAVQPKAGDWGRFVDVANESLVRNPPPASEKALLQKFTQVGICGQGCSWSGLTPEVQARWQAVAPKIEKGLKSALNSDNSQAIKNRVNGWVPYRLPKSFGNNYLLRAGSAAMSGGILGLEADEAIYFFASVDGNSAPLGDGASYKIHVPQGRLPADAFWSIALYEFVTGGQYMVENPINRYSIGDRTQGLKFNADGSLDIWVSPTDPGPEKRANWLPSPATNKFYVFARLYQPWPEVLDLTWSPEPVVKLAP